MEADATKFEGEGEKRLFPTPLATWRTFREAPPLAVKTAVARKRKWVEWGMVREKEREEASSLFLATSTHRCALQSDRAPCFIYLFSCLLINISEHYAWDAPVTLNMGGLSTFFSDKSSSNAQ